MKSGCSACSSGGNIWHQHVKHATLNFFTFWVMKLCSGTLVKSSIGVKRCKSHCLRISQKFTSFAESIGKVKEFILHKGVSCQVAHFGETANRFHLPATLFKVAANQHWTMTSMVKIKKILHLYDETKLCRASCSG